jgi:uncharacterized phage-associated protein
MKLMKLVYISHGWNLAIEEEPLIYEPIQAWQYGPVIESLYRGLKRFGNSNVTMMAFDSSLPIAISDSEPSFNLIEKVWEKYSHMPALALSSLTHQPGTPWDIIWNEQGGRDRKGAIIPDALIQDFYKQKLALGSERGN